MKNDTTSALLCERRSAPTTLYRPAARAGRGLFAHTIRGVFAGVAVALALAGCGTTPMASNTAAKFSVPGLNLAMIRVEPGTFMLGRPPGSGGEPDESPETKVTFTKAFWLGATLVTVAEWRQFYRRDRLIAPGRKSRSEGMWAWTGRPGASYEQQPGTSWRNPGRDEKQDENNPVVGIGWDDTQQFCAWLTKRERAAGRLPNHYAYSLPTEAQWQNACKAGNRRGGPSRASTPTPGTWETAARRPTRWLRSCPTPGDFTTWWATRGNGARTGTHRTRAAA